MGDCVACLIVNEQPDRSLARLGCRIAVLLRWIDNSFGYS